MCGHRFADLSEHGFGVALMNNSKYGYSCLDSTLSLSLLRSPKNPDPECDMGQHTFLYALLPHDDTVGNADVVRNAAALNQGVLWFVRVS